MRLGVSARTEIRLVVPNYLAGITGPDPTGFCDVALGVKQQFGPLPGGFDLSVIAAVSLPTGASRVSSHGYAPFVKFPWSKDLHDGHRGRFCCANKKGSPERVRRDGLARALGPARKGEIEASPAAAQGICVCQICALYRSMQIFGLPAK